MAKKATKKKTTVKAKPLAPVLAKPEDQAPRNGEDRNDPLLDVLNNSVVYATPGIVNVYREAKVIHTRMIKDEMDLLPLKKELEEFFGLHGRLWTPEGPIELATFTVQNKKIGDCFDFDRFGREHPDLLEKYMKPGSRLQRVFRFK